MATHSGVLAWRIPGMAKPGGLPSMGSHRVGHDWSDLAMYSTENYIQYLIINHNRKESEKEYIYIYIYILMYFA